MFIQISNPLFQSFNPVFPLGNIRIHKGTYEYIALTTNENIINMLARRNHQQSATTVLFV